LNVKEEDEALLNQSLFFTENGKQVVAADLKYSYILGQYANFRPRTELFTSAIRAIVGKNEFSGTVDKSRTEMVPK
jgi:hypothetical protein